MQIRLKYFGKLQEITGLEEELFEIENNISTAILSDLLRKKYKNLDQADYRIALNQAIVNGDNPIHEKDEIALLPPFAGG